MPPDRVQQLLQEVKNRTKAAGTNVDGYEIRVARSAADNSILAFVFYSSNPSKLDKDAILVTVKETESGLKVYPPCETPSYAVNTMLWKMGAKGHSFQGD